MGEGSNESLSLSLSLSLSSGSESSFSIFNGERELSLTQGEKDRLFRRKLRILDALVKIRYLQSRKFQVPKSQGFREECRVPNCVTIDAHVMIGMWFSRMHEILNISTNSLQVCPVMRILNIA
ncbi:hypothetical protein L211DRAFT_406911 [Terfezia boudieri ATCC MYA-4762]|uniref:Uncharacterized protein n=1 Tax=Terfezia boudieri ATCC MYA-4762 TaxID=1051890 RepID=A0A3N4M145_9PEZI|nr:hypothetical protein L211DRAFT_406911 [Terfezia boudieri ATCC MYA-4762]